MVSVSSVTGSSSTLCTVAKDIFYPCTVVIPEAFFCAIAVDGGNGNSGKINNGAQAWHDASQRLREFHDELAGIVHSVPHSEWQAADREAYEQQANKYLEQVTTSATAAEVASVMLNAAADALFVFATFSVAMAGFLAVNAAAVAAADCTLVGAPEAEAEGNAVGGEVYELMNAAGDALQVLLSGIAAAMGVGAFADFGVLASQGDTAAGSDFGQATLSGLKTDAKMLPKETLDYAKDKVTDHIHEKLFPKETKLDGVTSGTSDSGSQSSGNGGSHASKP